MLFTSVIDPALVEELVQHCEYANCTDDKYTARKENASLWICLFRHVIRTIKHSHTLVRVPDLKAGTREALCKLRDVDTELYQKMDALLNDPRRIVDMEDPIGGHKNDPPEDDIATRKALSLTQEQYCDLVFTGVLGHLILEDSKGIERKKVVTPASYQISCAAEEHAAGWGGAFLTGDADAALNKCFEPFLRWAEDATIVEPHIASACMKASPFARDDGRLPADSFIEKAQASWQTFKTTIDRINAAWSKRSVRSRRELEVVTVSASGDIRDRDPESWNAWCPDKSADKQGWCEACYLHEQLSRNSSIKNLRVTLIDETDVKRSQIKHDRWLIDRTRGRALNLSRGFDLFMGGQTRPCMVSLMPKIPAKKEQWSLADIKPWAKYP